MDWGQGGGKIIWPTADEEEQDIELHYLDWMLHTN